MTVLAQLATALGRRDQTPNQDLARRIAGSGDETAVQELVENLALEGSKLRGDCIKVLYEIGETRPDLIARHCDVFCSLLDSADNRLVWGAMTALDAIVSREPARIYRHLGKILDAADRGSVIAKDHAMGILVGLASFSATRPAAFPYSSSGCTAARTISFRCTRRRSSRSFAIRIGRASAMSSSRELTASRRNRRRRVSGRSW